MAPPRFLPSDPVIKSWIEEGISHRHMADRVRRWYGKEVRRSTISSHISRRGWSKPNYTDLIPGPIREDHNNAYPLVMLRYLARRMSGEELRADRAKRLDSWLERCDREDVCVAYRRGTFDGWFYVRRRPQDAGKYSRLD